MPHEEFYGTRELTFSAWHRSKSIERFVGHDLARTLGMIDLDALVYVECEDGTWEPLVFIEVARDKGQKAKPARGTKKIAARCGCYAFVVLYTGSRRANPADPNWPDIESFRVKRIWPEPETSWRVFTPEEWAKYLVSIRRKASAEMARRKSAAHAR